jgi:hypothetical protein
MEHGSKISPLLGETRVTSALAMSRPGRARRMATMKAYVNNLPLFIFFPSLRFEMHILTYTLSSHTHHPRRVKPRKVRITATITGFLRNRDVLVRYFHGGISGAEAG